MHTSQEQVATNDPLRRQKWLIVLLMEMGVKRVWSCPGHDITGALVFRGNLQLISCAQTRLEIHTWEVTPVLLKAKLEDMRQGINYIVSSHRMAQCLSGKKCLVEMSREGSQFPIWYKGYGNISLVFYLADDCLFHYPGQRNAMY